MEKHCAKGSVSVMQTATDRGVDLRVVAVPAMAMPHAQGRATAAPCVMGLVSATLLATEKDKAALSVGEPGMVTPPTTDKVKEPLSV